MRRRYAVELVRRHVLIDRSYAPRYQPKHHEIVDDGVRYIDGKHIHVFGLSLKRKRPKPDSLVRDGVRFYMDSTGSCLVVKGREIYCKAGARDAIQNSKNPIERCLIPRGKYIPDVVIAMPFEMFE